MNKIRIKREMMFIYHTTQSIPLLSSIIKYDDYKQDFDQIIESMVAEHLVKLK